MEGRGRLMYYLVVDDKSNGDNCENENHQRSACADGAGEAWNDMA